MNTVPIRSSRDPADILTIGFGMTVAMWGVGYVCRLPGAFVPSGLLVFLLAACMVLGGFVAGRYGPRGWRGGLDAGLLTGVLNLLILGSLLGGEQPNQLVPSALWWITGALIVSMLAAGGGGILGRLVPYTWARTPNWRASFAGVAAVATLLLLAAGGLVTGYEAGLAVVDWPNSFGYYMFLYPLSRMAGDIYYEHAHRLLGSLVGLTTLVLAAYLQFVEQRRWLRRLAGLTLAAVIVQGVLGGLRVTGRFTLSTSAQEMSPSIALAIVHGVMGQLVFGTVVAISVFLSSTWRSARAPMAAATAGTDRALGTVLVILLFVQLILGAVLRHTVLGLLMHITLGVVVLSFAVACGLRAWGLYDQMPILPGLGRAVLVLIGVQLGLGIAALVVTGIEPPGAPASGIQALVTTAHQTTGAVLLACAAMLLLWNCRLLSSGAEARLPSA